MIYFFICLCLLKSKCSAFCNFFLSTQVEHKSLTLGEVLDGDRMALSLYDIRFLRKCRRHAACDVLLRIICYAIGIVICWSE